MGRVALGSHWPAPGVLIVRILGGEALLGRSDSRGLGGLIRSGRAPAYPVEPDRGCFD